MRLLSRILAWLLAWGGGLMIFEFLYLLFQGGLKKPFWSYVIVVLVFGVLPLFGGIQLLRRRYEALNHTMRFICIGGVADFAFCSALHLVFPDFAPSQLGIIAVSGLIAAILSGIIWLTAWIRWRSKKQRQGRMTERVESRNQGI